MYRHCIEQTLKNLYMVRSTDKISGYQTLRVLRKFMSPKEAMGQKKLTMV